MPKLLTYLFLLFAVTTVAQTFEGNLKIENITFPEGNQLAYAYNLSQDSTGLIWIRQRTDFYTYNGHKLSKVEQEVMGIPMYGSNRFFAEKTHPLFYINRDSLVVYDPVANEVVQMMDNVPENLGGLPKPKKLEYIGISRDGACWGIAHTGDFEYSYVVRASNGGAFQLVDSINISWQYGAALVRDDHYFVKLSGRVEEYDATGRIKVYRFPSGPNPVMTNMVKDVERTIWTVHSPDLSKSQFGVYYLKEGQDEFKRLPKVRRFPQEERHGEVFSDGEDIWHRGYPFRLSRLKVADGTIEDFTEKIIEQSGRFPFYSSSLLNVFRDRSGEVWLNTVSGIVKMTVEEDLFRKIGGKESGLKCADGNCVFRGMAEDEAGNIYLSHADGIAMLNPETGQLSALPVEIPPGSGGIYNITYLRGTLFWNKYATDLKTYQTRQIITPSSSSYLTHGVEPGGSRVWIGVNAWPFQLFSYDLETGKSTEIKLPSSAFPNRNDEIRQVHYSPTTGTLFLAIWMEGLLELDLDGRVLNHYEDSKPPRPLWHNNSMYGLYEDHAGQLWVAHGAEAGLSKMDLKTREIIQYPYQINKFTGSLKRVFRILPDKDGFLWLFTEKGTLRLDKKSRELTRFPMFPTFSDMASHLWFGHAAKDGTLYFKAPNGILHAFDPEALYKKAGFDQDFPVVIDRYERLNEKQDSLFTQLKNLANLSEIHLTHRDRYFNLEFFVPDFRNTSQNLYSYWLEGYDKGWSTPNRINQLRYENLPPGKYTLHIRGGLSPEFYESSERVIEIFVAPAWYKTWWAYSLYAAIILGLFFLYYQYQIRRQLEKAEARRLKEMDSLKTRLYTNITHEFRTPLTVIMGMTEQLAVGSWQSAVSPAEKGKLKSAFSLIRRNSKNLLRLINQLLDLSKLDSGTMKMDMVRSDVINYLQYLTESFYSMAHEKKVRLTFYSEIPELVMDFDEVKIQHIIYNLLSNALKFTGKDGKVVLHANQSQRNGQPYLRLKVQDTGVGIPEDQVKHIFDRFYQADNSSTRKGEGTGIGLALTKELVELMGGSITVESTVGKETIFTLLLPVRLEANTPLPQDEFQSSSTLAPELVPDLADTQTSDLSAILLDSADEKPTLLIIEDNPDVVTYIVGLLKKEYELHTAPNGQIGIEMAFEMVPDIIISDVMMPEKDGYEVCETLKNDERTSHIPIVLLTAKATTQDRIEGLRSGADAYLVKPFHKEELFVRLAKLIVLRKALQASFSGGAIFSKNAVSKKEPTLDDLFLQKLIKVVEEKLDDPDLNPAYLCQVVNRSNTQVNRKLKALTGKTPSQFIRSIRLQKAIELLKTTDLNISEIAYDVGFNDPNYFSRSFSEEYGHPPNAVRK